MKYRKLPTNDGVWRVMDRGPAPAECGLGVGVDCYVFCKSGGSRPTDLWSIAYMPVERFRSPR